MSHLDDKERSLLEVFNKAPKAEKFLGYRAALERRLFKSKAKAFQIRARSSQLEGTLWSVWEKYFGVLPPVVCDVVIWYDDARNLERDVLIFSEKVAREQYQAELFALRASFSEHCTL